MTTNPDPGRGLKVAVVVGTTTGGTGRHVRSVVAGLAAGGAQVVVFGPRAAGEMFDFGGQGARFETLEISDRPRPGADLRTLRRLRRALRSADVVHAHGLRAGSLAALAMVGRRVPLVVTLHNAVVSGGAVAVIYGLLERIVARRADLVLGVSPDLEERMRALGAREVGHAIVPAPPAERASSAAADAVREELEAGERPLIVVVGRLAEQKGLPTLLDAAAGWARRAPSPLVAVAGGGPLEDQVRARITAEGLPVRLLGHRSDVPALLAAADVAVVPSVWEGQPLIVQEMLRAGCPIVATRVGGIPGMTGEEAALLVPPNDAEALRAAVDRVLDEPETAASLAEAARKRAAELPGEADAVLQLKKIYEALTAGASRPYREGHNRP